MAFEIPKNILTTIRSLMSIHESVLQVHRKQTNSDKKIKTRDVMLSSASNLFEYILFNFDKIFPANVEWSKGTEKFYVCVHNKALEFQLNIKKNYEAGMYNIRETDRLKKILSKVIGKLEDVVEILDIFENPCYEKECKTYKSISKEYSELLISGCISSDDEDTDDEDSDDDETNDSSSDFELNSIEDKIRVKQDTVLDENLSLFVDQSDDEEEPSYKRTYKRASNKLNKEIMNAYKTKKRRRTNKNNNANTNNNKKTIEVIIPTCTTNKKNTTSSTNVNKEIMNSYKKRRTNKNNKTVEKKTSKTPDWLQNFDNLYWGIPPLQKSNCPIYFSRGPVNEDNLSIYFYEKLNWEEEIVTEYDNYKVWSFVDETDTFAYILLDKRLSDWYVMCNKSSSKKISKSYSKLALKEFVDGHLVYKSSNISDVIRIAFSALS
jgi:hypothetical protein